MVDGENHGVKNDQPEGDATDFLTHIVPRARMETLVVPDALKEELEEIVFYCAHKEAIDEQIDPNGLKTHGVFINFHGRSGTGKTLSAEIIAGILNKELFVVNYANLESELVGRTSKNIHAIFELAQKTNCVLMFDEADSFLSARITDLRQSADYGINTSRSQLLKELDSYNGVVLFATNNIHNYDIAFQRRLHYNIEFPLPDPEGRYQIVRKHCLSNRISADVNFRELADKMEEFSGGDIQNVVKRAVVRGMQGILGRTAETIDQRNFEHAISVVRASKEAFTRETAKGIPLQVVRPSLAEDEGVMRVNENELQPTRKT
jgi:ATP-dependent 26S proteasome regulatory subunit